jgi:hypothetical protein
MARRANRGKTGHRWKPGQSGNPNGRPKEAFHVRDLARAHTTEAIATLVKIMRKSKQDKARAQAAQALLDRGWGRPIQEMWHGGEVGESLAVKVYLPENGR